MYLRAVPSRKVILFVALLVETHDISSRSGCLIG
jgi:hypothetical protein